MDLIMDGLLVAGTLFAGAWCWVLSRRVKALKDLDSGLGGAITTMTCQIEEARRALEDAKSATRDGRQELRELINRADAASGQLRILLAAMKGGDDSGIRRPLASKHLRGDSAQPRAAQTPAAPAHDDGAPRAPQSATRAHVAPPVAASGTEAPGRADVEPEPSNVFETAFDDDPRTLPKPRRPFPLQPLRPRAAGAASAPPPRSEDEILSALSTLVGPQRI